MVRKYYLPYPFKNNNPPTSEQGDYCLYCSWWLMAYSSCQARKALALSSLIGQFRLRFNELY